MTRSREPSRWFRLLMLAAILFGLAPPSVHAAAKAEQQEEKDRQTLRAVLQAIEVEDCKSAIKILDKRLRQKQPIEPPQLAAVSYEILASCQAEQNDFKAAARSAFDGTQISVASDRLWLLRIFAQQRSGDLAEAVATVEAMNNGRGKALNSVPTYNLYTLDNKLREEKRDAERLRLLAVLAGPAYAPEEPLANPDGFRARYADLLINAGRTEEAAQLLGEIRDTGTLVDLMLDSRYRPMLPGDLDIRAGIERELTDTIALTRLRDDMLKPVLDANRRLLALGRPEEGLALLKRAQDRPGGLEGQVDAAERLNWWWDSLGRTYAKLGRYDEMVHAFDSGARINEDGTANVSQIINLAGTQIDFGRSDDALKTIEAFGIADRRMSPYGMMQMRYVRGCALVQTGRNSEAAADIAFMREHRKDAPFALADMLLCTGDIDGAAEIVIDQLADPERRATTLRKLSDYDDPLPSEPKGVNVDAFKALRGRPDVQEAIAQAGGILRFHFQRGEEW